MWLFTTLGFFSITTAPLNPGSFQIRARERSDLHHINEVFGIGAEIVETPDADYRWRIVIRPAALAEIFAMFASTINYGNFKDAVHHAHGQERKSGPYLRVWTVMRELQDRGRELAEVEPGAMPDWFAFHPDPSLHDGPQPDPLDNPKARKPTKKSKARKALDANRP